MIAGQFGKRAASAPCGRERRRSVRTVAAVPPFQGDVCDALGKPIALTFEYVAGTTVTTAQGTGKADILFDSGAVDDDGVSYVIATDQENASSALGGIGKRFFEGNVAFNATFEANEDIDSFSSKTFIHFFDDATGGLLQSIEYHTSCSQPIQLADVIGNATLVAYEGESGSAAVPPPPPPPVIPPLVDLGSGIIFSTDNPFNPGNIGQDADSPTGPLAQIGDKVTYTYQVSNAGQVALTIEDLVDDNATPGDASDDFTPAPVLKVNGFNVGDANNDGIVDPDEVWYFQVMQIATEPGQHANTAEVTAFDSAGTNVRDDDASNHLVNPLVFEKFVFVPTDLPGQEDVCDIFGKPVALTFEYVPGTTVNTAQNPDKAEILFDSGMVDDDGVSFIIVTDEQNATNALNGGGKRFFEGDVAFDDLFEANEDLDNFGSTTYIHYFDDSDQSSIG